MVTIEYNRKTNVQFDLVVTNFEQRKRPEEQIEVIDIEGRNGSLVDRHGVYRSYQRTIEMVNLTEDKKPLVHKWLSGRGILRTSEDPAGFSFVDVLDTIERKYIGERHSFIAVTFLCEPHFYLDAGMLPIEITTQKSLMNIGTDSAEPLIKVYGTGNGQILINEQVIPLTGIEQHLTIDTKLQIVHKDGLPAGRKMSGPFPVLGEGQNLISFTGGITKLELTPRWREL